MESVRQTNYCGDIDNETTRQRIKKTKTKTNITKLSIFASHSVLLVKLFFSTTS